MSIIKKIEKIGSKQFTAKDKRIIYLVTTILISIAYLITGIGNMLPFAHIAQDMAHLGYPTYFLKIIGTWKILAAITILIPGIPRIKEWAYAGMIFDLTGAAISRFAMSDGLLMVLIPLVIAGFVILNLSISRSIVNNGLSSR